MVWFVEVVVSFLSILLIEASLCASPFLLCSLIFFFFSSFFVVVFFLLCVIVIPFFWLQVSLTLRAPRMLMRLLKGVPQVGVPDHAGRGGVLMIVRNNG